MSNPISKLVETTSEMTLDAIKRTVESARYTPISEYDVAYNEGIKTALRLIEIFQLEMKIRKEENLDA